MPINRRNREEVELTVKRNEKMMLLIGSYRNEESNKGHNKSNTDGKHKQSKKMKTMMVVMLSIQHRRDAAADEGGRESKEKR